MQHPEGHRWKVFTQQVFAIYGDLCCVLVCKHGGARQVGHLEPVTERPDLVFALSNCRPIHGSPKNPCPVCSVQAGSRIFCNQIQNMGSLDRARRIIAERIEKRAGGKTPPNAKSPRVREAPGREWLPV